MFCPKCSEAQVSEKVRFCKRCGFRLEAVQDLVANEEMSASRSDSALPQQKHIGIGAGLMFIGSVVAMLWAQGHMGGDADVLPQVYLILAFTLGFILLLFDPLLGLLKKLLGGAEQPDYGPEGRKRAAPRAKQRDGINLGALLMFLGTIKAMALSTLAHDHARRPVLTIAISSAMLLMLLIIRWLVESVYGLYFKNSESDPEDDAKRVTSDLASALNDRAAELGLPPVQVHLGIPHVEFTPTKVGITQPASVTEKTTDLLGKQ